MSSERRNSSNYSLLLSLRSEPESCKRRLVDIVPFPVNSSKAVRATFYILYRNQEAGPKESTAAKFLKYPLLLKLPNVRLNEHLLFIDMLERANNLLVTSRHRLDKTGASSPLQKSTAKPRPVSKPVVSKTQNKRINKILHFAPVLRSRGPPCILTKESVNESCSVSDFEIKNTPGRDRIKNGSSINISAIKPVTPKLKKPPCVTLESVIESLDLCELLPTFAENKMKLEDLLLLSREDMKEMGIPIYGRNRILAFQKYFQTHKEEEIIPSLLHQILKSLYNPSFIVMLNSEDEPADISTANQKISIIAKEGSPNEDRSLARLAFELKENSPDCSKEAKAETIPPKSQTPSFSARSDMKFGDNKIQTERRPQKCVLQELSFENQDPRDEMRNFEQEYGKIRGNPPEEKKRSEFAKNVISGPLKASDKHKEQLERYRAEMQSIFGIDN